jgi:TRAP-type uncharacterized transport system substrate-binding protein
VIGQLDHGPDLALVSIPSIATITELQGKSLIVDSPSSGYAFLLRKILSANGLYEGADYFFQVSVL